MGLRGGHCLPSDQAASGEGMWFSRCVPSSNTRNLSRLLLVAVTRAEALSVREIKTIFFLSQTVWQTLTRRDHSLTSESQHCVTVLLVVCDSLALGPSLQTQTHVEEKHQDSGTPPPSGFDENSAEARPPIKLWAPASPSPQLFNITRTLSLQAGALCLWGCMLADMFRPGEREVGGSWEKEHIWGLLGGTWELSAASSPFPHHSSLLCTTHGLHRGAYWLSGSFPCPELPPLRRHLAAPITEWCT